ncbi:MAG: hypothetical protein GXY83_24785 [Rhodopirellula sp.]|nr:hypothetical protein [Rhodopirellula sp.]
MFADEGEAGVEDELAEMGFGEAGKVGGELETLRVGIGGRIEVGGLEAGGESVEIEHGEVESREPERRLRVEGRESDSLGSANRRFEQERTEATEESSVGASLLVVSLSCFLAGIGCRELG